MNKKSMSQTRAFTKLLGLAKILPTHLESLNPTQQLAFRKLLTDKLATLTGEERDAFLEKVGALIDPDKIWEYNHGMITEIVQAHIVQHGAMPSTSHLAGLTGLSRKTVSKHLHTFNSSLTYTEQKQMQSLMSGHVISKVLQAALNGNISAAKLYLDHFKQQNSSSDIVINNQNNYLQINGTVLNQQTIQQLKPEQLIQIEALVKKSLKESKID